MILLLYDFVHVTITFLRQCDSHVEINGLVLFRDLAFEKPPCLSVQWMLHLVMLQMTQLVMFTFRGYLLISF